MTATFLGAWPDGSPAWHEARAGRVGGSDIGVIIGVSPFESRAQLLHRKAGLLVDKKQSAAMERGHLLEPAILTYLCRKLATTIDDALIGTYVSGDNDRHLYNPDGITTTGLLLEAKSTTDRSTDHGWGRAGTDQIPDHYLAQVVWGAGILGLKEWRLGVLAGATNGRPDLKFATYKGKADPDLYASLRSEADRFLADLHELTSKESAA